MRLSAKHGLNPCMSECFICGEVKEIVLTGAAGDKMAREMGRGDGEMPRQAVFDLNPCEECKKQGISLIEMTSEGSNAQPTGVRLLMRAGAARRMITDDALWEQVSVHRAAFIDVATWDLIGLPRENIPAQDGSVST